MKSSKIPVLKIEFTSLSLARILSKSFATVLAVFAVGTIVSVLIAYHLKPVYRSEALILLDSQDIPDRYVPSPVNGDVQDKFAALTEQILSITQLQKIIDTFGLYKGKSGKQRAPEEVMEMMRRDIHIHIERAGERDRPVAFHVGYRGNDPQLVMRVASKLADLFINENFRTREEQASGTSEFLDNQLREAEDKLNDAESRLRAYKRAHNGFLPEQEGSLNSTLSRLQLALQGTQDAINRAHQNSLMLQAALDIALASPLNSDAQKNPMGGQELNARKRVEDFRARLALADREIAEEMGERRQMLTAIADYQARVQQLPLRELEMAPMARDYDVAKANYRSLLDKKLTAVMATDSERQQRSGRFRLVDPPRIPERPIGPQRVLLAASGCLLSLALAITLAIALDAKKNTLLGEWELGSDLAVLGRVPALNSLLEDSNRVRSGAESRIRV